VYYTRHIPQQEIDALIQKIKDNDGFLGTVREDVRTHLLKGLATVETSPITGLDVQWTLTTKGKQRLRQIKAEKKQRQRNASWFAKNKRDNWPYPDYSVVPLTVEVLDALKSIRENGEPGTPKLDILARIQRKGAHAAKTVKDVAGGSTIVYGALAEYKDGVWSLTDAGKRVEAGHIRKSECAQFSGDVR
jgi:hypothetical protein